MSGPTFIYIDGSYFCFYRYHALLTWWKNAYPEQSEVLLDPYNNEKFVEKFITTANKYSYRNTDQYYRNEFFNYLKNEFKILIIQ